MVTEFILPLSIIFGLVNFGLIAAWYIAPALDRLPRATALKPILLFHTFRYLGLSFLIPGVVGAGISPLFAVPAAYGDLAAALLALISVIALHRQWPVAVALIWTFNLVGTLDLLNAVFQRARHVPTGDLGGAYLIPALIVPALLVTHVIVFRLLVRSKESYTESHYLPNIQEPSNTA